MRQDGDSVLSKGDPARLQIGIRTLFAHDYSALLFLGLWCNKVQQ